MGLVQQDQQGQPTLTCPTCRQVTPIPASGVAGLQAAFQINKLLEIVEEHKMAKASALPEGVETAATSPPPRGNTTIGCPKHGGREVELYCKTCEELICYRCIAKDEKHHSHDYEELSKAVEKEVTSSLEPLEKQLTTIQRALVQLEERRDEISDQQATIEIDIHKAFTHIIGNDFSEVVFKNILEVQSNVWVQ